MMQAMPDTGGVRYYVLTLRGERGPVDRKGLRELLQQGEIRPEDQVRNAFGRNLGTVRDVLASQPRGVPSGRHSEVAAAPAEPPARSARPVLLLAAGAVVLIIIVVAVLASGGDDAPRPAPSVQPEVPVSVVQPVQPPPPVAPPETEVVAAAPPPPAGKVAHCSYALGEAYANGEYVQAGEGLQQCLDGRASSKWLSRIVPATAAQMRRAWLRLDPRPAGRRIAGYALTSANDFAERDPLSWTLVGIIGNGEETVLDHHENEHFALRFQRREFRLPKPVSFPAYRLDIIEVAGGKQIDVVQLADIALLPAP